ncbi:MAG: hypothetical protein KAQ68_03790 [Clostridiales bacterium]|nr:hypothetical protein [Clostridiales bacterium]
MRYTAKVRLRKAIYIAIAIIVFIALNYFLITKVFITKTPIEKSAVEIANGVDVGVFPYDDGSVVVIGDQLVCYDTKGVALFTTTLPAVQMKAQRNGDLTICWQENVIMIIDELGIAKPYHQLGTVNILMATCSPSQYAVALIEEDQLWLRVYDLNGILIEQDVQPFLSALSIGYFGEKNEQLWALMLDYHGTLPITRLYTSHPGNSQTGRITINDQVCYDLVPVKDFVYIIGTHHIQSRTYTNKKLSEWLINGWALQDTIVNDSEDVTFLLAPVDTTGMDVPLSALWYINPNNSEQYRISMPAGILRAVLTDKKIYAISPQGIYNMSFNGKKRGFSKLTFAIDEVIGVSSGKAVVVRSGEKYYTVALH